MNPLVKALASGLGQVLAPMRAMRHPGQTTSLFRLLKRTKFDYAEEVGDGLDASVLLAPIFWLQRALPEAVLALRETKSDKSVEDIDDHDMLALIQKPNPFYGDLALWSATILSFLIDGNAYWLKVRNSTGKVIQLWWAPCWMVEPKAGIDGTTLLSHYEYSPGTGYGRMIVAPEDVVHFRHGINPRDLRKGLSPIQGVLREIFTDLESSNFIASLLRNMGVPGVVISPKGGAMPSPDDVSSVKSWFQQAFGGDNRGKPMILGAPTEVSQFGFNPEQMNLRHGSDRAEERVCASLGVPAAVVGFGAGLQQTKVGATMEELRKLAWHNGVLPLGRQLVDELKRSLLPDFQRSARERGRRFELYWNTDDVLALQEDEDKQTERKLKEFERGVITLFEYRTETGREADDSHKFYVRQISQLIEPEGEALKRAAIREAEFTDAPPALPAPEDDGTGDKSQSGAIETKHADDFLPADAVPATKGEIERGERFIVQLERAESGQSEAFEQAMLPVFQGWGDEGGQVVERVLRGNGEKASDLIETKAPDSELVQRIIDLLNLEAWEEQLSARYQAQYVAIARQVAQSIEDSGYGTNLPDPVMREILAQGGTRAGLIDLPEQTRKAVFDALAEGRAQGEGVTALANRIANKIEAGRYKDPQTRALVIARIETKHAQNFSTIKNGAANGFSRFIVFDGRLGPGRSEPSHIARSGMIVTTEGALAMTAAMRPNCTLSFAPHIQL